MQGVARTRRFLLRHGRDHQGIFAAMTHSELMKRMKRALTVGYRTPRECHSAMNRLFQRLFANA